MVAERGLAALKAITGVDQVYSVPKNKYDAKGWNANHVECRITFPDGSMKKMKEHCSEEAPLKSAAAARLISRVAEQLNILSRFAVHS